MRTITLRYAGECRQCGASLEAGAEAGYEKRVGVFCPPCMPTDTGTIRQYRQQAADKRADQYEDWAAKRRDKAEAVLTHDREHYGQDWAFITQPGHIPIRARVIARDHRANEGLAVARRFEAKADSLRHVRVKGDAEAERQRQCDYIRPLLKPGMLIDSGITGRATVLRVNQQSVTVVTQSGWQTKVGLPFISIVSQPDQAGQ